MEGHINIHDSRVLFFFSLSKNPLILLAELVERKWSSSARDDQCEIRFVQCVQFGLEKLNITIKCRLPRIIDHKFASVNVASALLIFHCQLSIFCRGGGD